MLPPYSFDIVAIFDDPAKALALPRKILKAGIEPTSIEYMDNRAIVISGDFIKCDLPYAKKNGVYDIITVESYDQDELDKKMEKLGDLCDEAGAVEVLMADDRIWEKAHAGDRDHAHVAKRMRNRKLVLTNKIEASRSKIDIKLKDVRFDVGCEHILGTNLGDLFKALCLS